ncbi:MAG TPA: hypothetical protein VNG89_20945 [Vicinamibacterales bacterium]|nr:hypothetical protein [Vicinamibacterales bacterium]
MGFFKTSDGLPHSGRIAGVIYLVSLFPGCEYFQEIDTLCLMRIVSTAGWWLAFSDKRTPRTFFDLVQHPRRVLGFLALGIGLIGQFYFRRGH